MNKPAGRIIIWRFSDGRPGHDSQSKGLVKALTHLIDCQSYDLGPAKGSFSAAAFLSRTFPAGDSLPDPHLLIGAGHKTHLPMLCGRRARGGRIVVLMRPSLPAFLFDYCLVPEHDRPRERRNIIPTEGALNSVAPAKNLDKARGLILIGGESRHFRWDEAKITKQLACIFEHTDKRWLVTDSPRTPDSTRACLRSFINKRVEYVPYGDCGDEWLQRQLECAGTVWVSADSVSMLYEALSVGAAVGVLELEPIGASRVAQASQILADKGMVTTFSAWDTAPALPVNPQPLQEAARCAGLLLERLNLQKDRPT